jgi:hypothetical protein
MVMFAQSAETRIKTVFLILALDIEQWNLPVASSFLLQVPTFQRTADMNFESKLSHSFRYFPTSWPLKYPKRNFVSLGLSTYSYPSSDNNAEENLTASAVADRNKTIATLFETYAIDGLMDKTTLESMPPFAGLLVRVNCIRIPPQCAFSWLDWPRKI